MLFRSDMQITNLCLWHLCFLVILFVFSFLFSARSKRNIHLFMYVSFLLSNFLVIFYKCRAYSPPLIVMLTSFLPVCKQGQTISTENTDCSSLWQPQVLQSVSAEVCRETQLHTHHNLFCETQYTEFVLVASVKDFKLLPIVVADLTLFFIHIMRGKLLFFFSPFIPGRRMGM